MKWKEVENDSGLVWLIYTGYPKINLFADVSFDEKTEMWTPKVNLNGEIADQGEPVPSVTNAKKAALRMLDKFSKIAFKSM